MTEKEFRRIVEKQRRREERLEKKEKREKALSGVVKTAAIIGAGIGITKGGKYLSESGVFKKALNSKAFTNMSENVKATTEILSGLNKAVERTYQAKGLRMFTQDTSKSLANNLERYFKDFGQDVDKISTKSGDDFLTGLLKARRDIIKKFIDKNTIAGEKDILQNVLKKSVEEYAGRQGVAEDTYEKTFSFLQNVIDNSDKRLGKVNGRTYKSGFNPIQNAFSNLFDPKDALKIQKKAELLEKSGIDKKEFDDIVSVFLEQLNGNTAFVTSKDGAFGSSFMDNVLNNNDKFINQLNSLKKETFNDITKTLKEQSMTGQTMRKMGLKGVTVKDAIENRLYVEDFGEEIVKGFNIYDEIREAKALLNKDDFENLYNSNIDSAIFRSDKNDLLDLRYIGKTKDDVIGALADKFQVPFVGIKPFKMLDLLNPTGGRYTPRGAYFSKGSIMDTIEGSAEALTDDYYVLGSTLRKLGQDGSIETIRENVTLLDNNPFDVASNQIRRMTGRAGRSTERNTFQKITDLGRQDAASGVEKFIYKHMQKTDMSSPYSIIDSIRNGTFEWSDIGSEEKVSVLETIDEMRQYSYNKINTIQKDVMEIFSPINLKKAGVIPNDRYESMYTYFQDFADYKDAVSSFIAVNPGDAFAEGLKNETSYHSAYKKMQQKYLRDIGYKNIDAVAGEAFKANIISKKEFDSIQNFTASEYLSDVIRNGKSGDVNEVFASIRGETYLSDLAKSFSKDSLHIPNGEYLGSNPFEGNDKIVVNKTINPLKDINNILRNGGSIEDVFNSFMENGVYQFGFGSKSNRAGKDAMYKVSKGTTVPFFMGARLSDGLSGVGLGLGSESMTSTQDLYKNLYLKRVLLPLATIAGLKYANDTIGDLTGEEPSDALASTYAEMTIDVQRLKDITGLNSFTQSWGRTLSGSQHLFENPLGGAIKYASFGLIGDDRGAKELKRFYEMGDTPIRKSRGWGIGSASPIYGTTIERWDPSWYRKVIGEPEMTDVQWGSESEYWRNHWLPTPSNPLGPIKTLIDPYHWERKHREDRPWAVSGRIKELNGVPLIGPIVDSTVGRIIKPTMKHPELGRAHEEMIRNINETIISQYNNELGYSQVQFSGSSSRAEEVDIYGMPSRGFISPSNGSSVYSEQEGFSGGFGSVSGYSGGNTAYGSANQQVVNQLSAINSQIRGFYSGDIKKSRSADIDSIRDDFLINDFDGIMNPNGLSMGLSDAYYSAIELSGIYGFYTESLFGDMEPEMILQDSTWALSLNKKFWDQRIGGVGGEISEIYRRFLPNSRKINTYNPIRNTMPDWMPSYENYFIDFQHGDPMGDLPGGIYRLPGAGYEAINKLNSDPYFGRYGALDRMKILGDVAPWSQQYKYYSKAASILHEKGVYTDEQYAIAQRVREQVSAQKKKYKFSEYKFSDQNLDSQQVTIDNILKDFSFTTKENPGEVYRLAGLDFPNADAENRAAVEEYFNKLFRNGRKITIKKSSDPLNYETSDTKNSIKVSAYVNGKNIQKELIDEYGVEANFDDRTDAANDALFGKSQKILGNIWEKVTHHDNFINNKFMRNRTAVEEYERNIVYGKSFQSWNHPIRDWIKPTANRLASQSPISSAISGAILGTVSGLVLGKSGIKKGAIIGATSGALLSSTRVIGETAYNAVNLGPDEAYIPGDVRKRREINEYFDKLKYVKYRGLYSKAAELAKEYEGVDIESLLEENKRTPYMDKRLREKLDGVKKWLAIGLSDENNMDEAEVKEKIKLINEFENGKIDNSVIESMGPYSRLALKYKNEYESTLYGADPYGDYMKIYASLPKEDRPFFQEFMGASPKDRSRILKLIPKNERKFFEARWKNNYKEDLSDNLISYFSTHKLPGRNWEGWQAGESLEKAKIKFINNIGENISDYGYFADDLKNSRGAPDISKHYNSGFSLNVLELNRVLKGSGLQDIEVFSIGSFIDSNIDKLKIDIDIKHNRKKEMEDLMYQELPQYM